MSCYGVNFKMRRPEFFQACATKERVVTMGSFSAMYKKSFRQILKPQGYSIWKSVFYKEVDNNICFFVYGKKDRLSGVIDIGVDVAPYCVDLRSNNYEPQESATKIIDIAKILTPEKVALENVQEYFTARFMANTEEIMLNSLSNICDDMEEIILPYIHKFVDLEYYYNELYKIMGLKESDERRYKNSFSYGLALKLHKYNNVLPWIEHQLTWHDNVVKRTKADFEELNRGNIAATFNMDVPSDFIAKLLKKRPNYVVAQKAAAVETIANSENKINRFQTIKTAILANDHSYLDRLVEKTEESSRDYIRQMIMGNIL